jgi:hypothetical protein
MLSCISFLDFIPLDLRRRIVGGVDDSEFKTGGRYAEVTVYVAPARSGPIRPVGLQNF